MRRAFHGRRRPIWLAASVASLIAALVLALTSIGGGNDGPAPPERVTPAPRSTHTAADRPAARSPRERRVVRRHRRRRQRARRRAAEARWHAAPPRRIEIPAIGVDAPVIPLGLNPDGSLQTPTDWGDTGWYTQGPEPGEPGPAVITGHVDSTTGPAVFYALREVERGDEINVHRKDGTVARFTVKRLEEWPKTSFPTHRVYGATRHPVLRLVTCAGDFDESTGHYVDNTIVYAGLARDRS